MSRQIQLRRGTTAQNDKFTGAVGEVTVDTDAKTLRVHDGETPGGTVISNTDYATEASLPSGNYVDMALLPSISEYIAPANGYYMLAIFSGGSEYCNMTNETNGIGVFKSTNLAGQLSSFMVPVCKNDRVTLNYNYSGAVVYFRFVYAKGEI